MKRDFISIFDLSKSEITEIFDLARELKTSQKQGTGRELLNNCALAMIFEKPSLRTRVTFETGIAQLGGHAIYLAPGDIRLGTRETVPDVAKNLSRWVDIVMARVFAHKTVEDIAKNASIPVINGLCDLEHPCQIMCDLFTVIEKKGSLKDVVIAYVGDGNNVCNSFVAASAVLGEFQLNIATPPGHEPDTQYLKKTSRINLSNDATRAVRNADIIYTDVWTSMGQEDETQQRLAVFKPFQINKALLQHAQKDYLIMHCLPAHRGEEITDEVIDSPVSIVFDQAENRLHIQKGIMVWLLQHSV
jgi:ornithine carbamoyltransferase